MNYAAVKHVEYFGKFRNTTDLKERAVPRACFQSWGECVLISWQLNHKLTESTLYRTVNMSDKTKP